MFTHEGRAVAHYLVDVRDVAVARLDQETPGQLGALARLLGDAGVSVLVQYSDHAGNLVLLVADEQDEVCDAVIARWGVASAPTGGS
ncbi:hypothetical protein [Streptomyces sp. NPDC057302]|uniref:hypothetical protein n=1 Tax=Streptomyces sp. NPDC057302 TaxID=3346094 RepID=UPI003631141E